MDEEEGEEAPKEGSKKEEMDKVYYVMSRTPHNITMAESKKGLEGYKYTLVEVSMLTAQKLMDLQEKIDQTERNIEEMTKKW